MHEIKSKSNDNIKYVRKLTASAEFRSEQKSFVTDGVRLCAEAFKSGIKIKKVFYTKNCFEKNSDMLQKIINSADEIVLTSESIMKWICDTESPQGVVCVCELPDFVANQDIFVKKSTCKLVVLENVQNPSNIGNIIRTCEALGVDGIVFAGNCCDAYNPKVLRGSMGGLFRIKLVFVDDVSAFASELKLHGFSIYGAVPSKKALILGKMRFDAKSAAMLGNEGNGLTDTAKSLCDFMINIPMNPDAESLSVSSAAAIIAWEMTKQGDKNE